MFLVYDKSIEWISRRRRLTCTTLFELFCHDGKDVKYFYYDFHDRICHSCGRWDFNIDLQPSEDMFDALKQVKESTWRSANSIRSLINSGVTITR